MHFLAISLRKDWARVRRDPYQFLTALGIPLVLAILMSLVFGRTPATPHGSLLVADEDGTRAAELLLSPFHSPALANIITIERVTRDAGMARIERGGASAFLIVPAGLVQAAMGGRPVRLELFLNPSQRILPQIVEETLARAVDTAFYLRRVPPAQLTRAWIGVDSLAAAPARPTRSFAAIFLPSMLFMGLLFLASGAAADIWRERTAGTLRRIASSPAPMSSYLWSRVVFVALLYAIAGVVGLLAAECLAAMPVANLPAAALWIAYSGVVFYLLFLWIAVQPATQRAASVLANLLLFPLAMLGGSFFPFEWMPAWMARLGRLTPNGWAIATFKSILDGTGELRQAALSALLLAALGGVAFVFTLRRLQRSFAI